MEGLTGTTPNLIQSETSVPESNDLSLYAMLHAMLHAMLYAKLYAMLCYSMCYAMC